MNNFINEYDLRKYVRNTKTGHKLFAVGCVLMLFLVIVPMGGLIAQSLIIIGAFQAFGAGMTHWSDSRARIKKLNDKLKNNDK